jgi:chemotaxis protein methyltransferase CheR
MRNLADGGRIDDALSLCQSLIASHRLEPTYHFYQALLLDQIARHDEALDALQKAIYLDRQYLLAHYYLGLAQAKRGDMEGSRRAFQNVLRLLEGRDPGEELPDADGMTAGDLTELARAQLDIDEP